MSARCDFCDLADPEWCYPCESYRVASLGAPVGGSSGAWAACAECAALIELDRWTELADRCVKVAPGLRAMAAMTRKDSVRAAVLALHAEFRRHRRGERTGFG